mmetsp:Transcript_45388/g.125131  ORF Transcript_45388/g.125131 Transcript_45388/m.125131 type:complete len:124 (-) Transcript_45388:109-480(-)
MSSSSRNKPPAFQQYKYYLSHTLNLEIMANISKLYLPTSQIGTSFNAIEGECRLSVQVFSNGEPMHLPVNTYSPPRLSQVQSTINWEDFLLFPVKYKGELAYREIQTCTKKIKTLACHIGHSI